MRRIFFKIFFGVAIIVGPKAYSQAGLVFRDNAEALPVISCEWCASKYSGWQVFTGGNQNINSQSPTHTLKALGAGEEGAPTPRQGSKSYQYKITRMPEYFNTCCQWTRAELKWGGCCEFTNTQWFIVSIYIPSDYCDNDDIPTQIAYDFKFTDSQGPASLSLWVESGRYVIQQLDTQVPNAASIDVQYTVPGADGLVNKGVWVDWVVHRNFSDNAGTGFVDVYKKVVGVDATLKRVYSQRGKNFNMQNGPNTEAYLQHGLYRWAWQNAQNQGEGDGSPVSCANDPKIIYHDQYIFLDATADSAQVHAILTGGSSPTNLFPSVNAGANQTITLPDTDAALDGTVSDADGTIASNVWTQISGPNTATMSSSTSVDQTVSNLIEGTYVFRLSATDDDGATSTDDMQIQVQSSTPPPTSAPKFTSVECTEALGEAECPAAPTPDQSIQLPISGDTIVVRAVHTNGGGYIQSFSATQLSGPNTATINQFDQNGWIPTVTNFGLTGLIEGTYVIKITAVDNDLTENYDTVNVVVVSATNAAPTVDAGANQNLSIDGFGAFLVKSTVLNATATDSDGSIASLQWIVTSGPENSQLGSPTNDTTTFGGLIGGIYKLRLLATDNEGAIGFDTITVTVYTNDAGSDQTIALPANSTSLTGTILIATDTTDVLWEKIGGPTGGNISSSGTLTTNISALQEGIYTYQLTVTYSNGIIVRDRMRITVTGGTTTIDRRVIRGQ